MSRSDQRELPVTVSFRVTPAQAALLQDAARPLSPGQYSRRIALAAAGIDGPAPGRRPLPKVRDAALLRATLEEMGHWGGNLNQLAHVANQGMPWSTASIDSLRADLQPILRRLISSLGADE